MKNQISFCNFQLIATAALIFITCLDSFFALPLTNQDGLYTADPTSSTNKPPPNQEVTLCKQNISISNQQLLDKLKLFRQKMFQEMYYYEDLDHIDSQWDSDWLYGIQIKYKCCGYNGPNDYDDFLKPSSCCDLTIKDKESIDKCLNPSINTDGSIDFTPTYFSQGCAYVIGENETILSDVLSKEFIQNENVRGTTNDLQSKSVDETCLQNIKFANQKLLQKVSMLRRRFFDEMKKYDEDDKGLPFSWLNDIQYKYKCCGYNGPRNYKKWFINMPPSCCDTSVGDRNANNTCLSPPSHKKQGCADLIERSEILLNEVLEIEENKIESTTEKEENENAGNETCAFNISIASQQLIEKIQIFHKQLYLDMKAYDDNFISSTWLNRIQKTYKCCGYNGPRDYKEFFKPPTCCDMSAADNNKELLNKCLNPPKPDYEGNISESPIYNSQGCADLLFENIYLLDEMLKKETTSNKSILETEKNSSNTVSIENQKLIQQVHTFRKRFYNEIKEYDYSLKTSNWLNRIQSEYKCCGYNGPRQYKEFFKPSSCCDLTINNRRSINRCLNPLKYYGDQNGNLGLSPKYISQGCADLLLKNVSLLNEVLMEETILNSSVVKNEPTSVQIHFTIANHNVLKQLETFRKRFYDDIKEFDDSGKTSDWFSRIQSEYKCCGYNGPRDYREHYKPPSCCDLTVKDSRMLKICLSPSNDEENFFTDIPSYFIQGCADVIETNSSALLDVLNKKFQY